MLVQMLPALLIFEGLDYVEKLARLPVMLHTVPGYLDIYGCRCLTIFASVVGLITAAQIHGTDRG